MEFAWLSRMSSRKKLWMVGLALPALIWSAALAHDEKPLGGRYDNVADRFNRTAEKGGLAVRLTRGGCKQDVLCHYSLGGSISGHGSAIDIGKPMLETMLFNHECTPTDAAVIRDAAAVFVRLFGRGSAGPALLDRLAAHVAREDDRQQAVTIGGVEFTNSPIPCTLFVARPLSTS